MASSEYESEYREHVSAATNKLDELECAASYELRRSICEEVEREIQSAKDAFEMVELQGRSLSGSAKTSLQATLRSYRAELSALRTRLKECRSMQTASSSDCIREDLFSPAGGSQGSDAGERARMLTTSDRLIKGNERLKNAHSVTLEMEGMAASILNDLSKQRETLMRSKSTLSYATQQLDVSRRVVQAMARRAATNKAVLYLIIALIGGVLLLTAWSQTNVAARR